MAAYVPERTPRTVLLIAISTLAALALLGSLAAADWPTVSGNATRQSSVAVGAPPEPYISWVVPQGYSDAATFNGRVYLAGYQPLPSAWNTTDGGLAFYQLDEATGTPP